MKKLIVCPECNSRDYVKAGKTHNGKQQYKCKNCKCRFIQRTHSYRTRFTLTTIAKAIYLYQRKQSLRDVAALMLDFFNITVSYTTVKYWIEKYGDKMKRFVSQFKYNFSGLWHFDEIFITWNKRNPKNRHQVIKEETHYCWNVMDAESRFLVYPEYSEERSAEFAVKAIKRTTEFALSPPQQVVSDSLKAYPIAINKVLFPLNHFLKHTQFVMVKGEHGNNLIERGNRTIRQRLKLFIGFRPIKKSTKILDMYYTYYDYVRPHTSLNNKTPAEVAGVDLKLEHNQNGILKLMRLSLNYEYRISLGDISCTSAASQE